MNKPCKHFKCTDADTCEYAYNGNCTGNGWNGYEHCGCDLCQYQKVVGPFIGCSILDRQEDTREEIYDWDDDYDPIKNP